MIAQALTDISLLLLYSAYIRNFRHIQIVKKKLIFIEITQLMKSLCIPIYTMKYEVEREAWEKVEKEKKKGRMKN